MNLVMCESCSVALHSPGKPKAPTRMSQIEVPEASPRLRQVLLSALAQPQSFGRDFYQRLFELIKSLDS